MGSENEREDKTDRHIEKQINDYTAHEYRRVTSNTSSISLVNNEIFYLKDFDFCTWKITEDVLLAAGAKVRTDGRTE